MKNNKVLKIAVITVLSIIALVYFYVLVFNANLDTDPAVDTEYAAKYSYEEKLTVPGVVMREETLINYSTDKMLYYTVDDGSVVRNGSEVAIVFENENDALGYKKIQKINEEIAMLEGLNTSYENVNTDFQAAEKQVILNVKSLINSVNNNDCLSLNSDTRELIYSINQRQIITGDVKDFDNIIKELKKERKSLESQFSAENNPVVTVDIPGYFVSFADGYEQVYNLDNIEKLSVEDFNNLSQKNDVPENTIGKVISGLNWFVACKLSAQDAIDLSHAGNEITLSFPDSSCFDIPATVVSINQLTKQSEAVVVFSCNYMSSPISHLRNETVEININTYNGLRISKESIHDDFVTDIFTGEDVKTQGVYVLRGSELVFKEISIIYSGSDFVIIDPAPKEGVLRSGETVALNDSVVVTGDNLYNGKKVK